LAHATQDITLVPYCPMVKFVWSRVGKIEWPDIDIDIDIDVDLDIDIDQNLDMDMDMDIAVSTEFCNVSIESMKHMRVVSGSCCDQNLHRNFLHGMASAAAAIFFGGCPIP
jgi:hypothetical protein